MGSNEDTMHQFERKELSQAFPLSDGWKRNPLISPGTNGSTHVFRRDLWVGSEFATVIVLYEPVVNVQTVAAIRTHYNNNSVKNRIFLMVPKNADVTSVPKDIGVIPMSSFGYNDGNLVWLTKKKNAKRFTNELPASTVS
jgi:hypothetical protein